MGAIRSRNTRRIRAIKAQMRAARRQPCMRCGQDIDYDAAPGEPNAFEAGHIKAWALYPELREDPGNYAPEHSRCNRSAGTAEQRGNGLGLRSREW